MLKALELAGFKSFADRTRFDFDRGISVVVGPNGSGKSNVVDAVKWVLGSQSVKALRGKQRSDVIFSGAGNRRPAGAAEVSLTFDNSLGQIDHDAEQVQISRRLYRSGEAEYLVNRQPCRLRDVRDVLASAGMASGAYSIIEQGKVDALLQSSPQDRRLLFEEAAGIGRFKTKREEAARRLERVQQNLVRLTDIVEELNSQLTRVRSQAGKAQKYKDLSERLQELRSIASVADWRRLSRQIELFDDDLNQRQAKAGELQRQVNELDAAIADRDQRWDELQRQARQSTSELGSIREQIVQCDTKHSSQLARIDELQQETQRLAHQLLTMTSRAGDSQQLVEETAVELQAAEEKHARLQASVAAQEERLAELDTHHRESETARLTAQQALEDAGRRAGQIENEAQVLQAKLESSAAVDARREEDLAKLQQSQREIARQCESAREVLTGASDEATSAAAQLKQRRETLAAARTRLARLQKQQADVLGRLSGARERTVVLEELERRLEGLNAGAKEALRRAREDPHGPYGAIRGVVADLLHVDADTAGLIEVALGERANYLAVVDAASLAAELAGGADPLPGRVTLLRLDVAAPASAVDRVDLSGEPGVVGRADAFVEATEELAGLVKRLLGRHWLVESLSQALRLAGGPGRGLNFVTTAGEVVAADGSLAVGPRQAAAGMLSRRSELRALREQVAKMQHELQSIEAQCARLEVEVPNEEAAIGELADRHAVCAEKVAEAKSLETALVDRLQRAEAKLAGLIDEVALAKRAADARRTKIDDFGQRLTECRETENQLQSEIERRQGESQRLAEELDRLRKSATEARVALAGSEQRRDGLRRQMTQLEHDHEERDRALSETRRRAQECVEARTSLQASNDNLAAASVDLKRRREALAEQLAANEQTQAEVRSQRSEAAAAVEEVRSQYFEAQKSAQQLQLQVQQLHHQRKEIGQRMQDDYKVDLAELAAQRSAEPIADRAKLNESIRRLQSDLETSGPVNLEAVEELDALEQRVGRLSCQLEDLQNARSRLEEIVGQINIESQQLFAKTIEDVREHFRKLFANLFGGGEADIVVEQEGDLLDCGIEIVARPPGKQPRSISLLSGGERTLTCVALLLAMFKSRPSPFCILDEVDAALDEANIDRFVEVLKEFMGATQFIVITHSKRTMSCGDTLYGVTMQESGVSKRVSVRFEDVTHDGHIKPRATGDVDGRRAA